MGVSVKFHYSLAGMLLLAVVLSSPVYAATFGCALRTSCNSNETVLIGLNSSEAGEAPNNSHAQLANYTPRYPYVVCCWTDSFRTMNNSCIGTSTRVIGLYATTDSHIQVGSNTSYAQSACLNVTSGNITCEYPNSACTSGYSGVMSMASSDRADNTSNAHGGEFAKYVRKVCCQIGAQNPPYVLWVNISPNMTATTRQDLECQNGTVGDVDGDSVTLHYNWYKNGTSITLLNLPMDYDSTNGITHDISGNGNHGAAVNATFLPAAGYVGGAFYFDRNLQTPNVWIRPGGTYDLYNKTIFARIKRASSGHWGGIFATCSTDFYFAINNGNSLIVSWTNSSSNQKTCSLGSITDTDWHTVALSTLVNGSNVNVTLYLDGSSTSCTNTQGMASASVTRYVGSFNSDCGVGGTVFNGTIDELMVFNRTLTSAEINTLFGSSNRYLNSTELRRTEGWNCSITPIDSTGLNGTTRYSNMTRINGSAPLASNLTYPANNNQSVFERFVNFSWTAADERDGDQVSYTLNATVTPGACGVQTTQSNILTTNYTYGELCVDQLYNWTINACDSDGCAMSNKFNFTIASVLSIRLVNNNTDFGDMNTSQSKSTDVAADNVTPFVVENDGNVLVNVSFVGNNSPFSSAGLGTTAFQFKARFNETNAFNTSGSPMTYTPVLSTFQIVLKQLNYSDANDTAYVDINITVPVNEPPGYKFANSTFSAVIS